MTWALVATMKWSFRVILASMWISNISKVYIAHRVVSNSDTVVTEIPKSLQCLTSLDIARSIESFLSVEFYWLH